MQSFTRISPSERRFVMDGVNVDVRVDGRSRMDYRHVAVECGVLPQANGSARVQLVNGDSNVLGAVKAEIAVPSADAPDKGFLECSVECWSSASPLFEGRAAEDINAELSNTLTKVVAASGAIDLSALCIVPGKHCWRLYLDVLVLDAGGSLMDTISIAAYAALNHTRLPKLHVIPVVGEGKDDVDIDVDDDPAAAVPLDASGVPVCVTFCQIGGRPVVDCRFEEERCATSRVMVAVNKNAKICAVEMAGTGTISPASLHAAIEAGARIGRALLDKVQVVLSSQTGKDSDVSSFLN